MKKASVSKKDRKKKNKEKREASQAAAEQKTANPKPLKEIRRGKELYVNEKKEETIEAKNEYKMRAFMIHPKNKRLYNKMKTKETIMEQRNTAL